MKVKYTLNEEDEDSFSGPAFGEVYEVLSIERKFYRIVDRSGDDYLYEPELFEIVDPLPQPPIITKFPRSPEAKIAVENAKRRLAKQEEKLAVLTGTDP